MDLAPSIGFTSQLGSSQEICPNLNSKLRREVENFSQKLTDFDLLLQLAREGTLQSLAPAAQDSCADDAAIFINKKSERRS
jgi:hypothetical protein